MTAFIAILIAVVLGASIVWYIRAAADNATIRAEHGRTFYSVGEKILNIPDDMLSIGELLTLRDAARLAESRTTPYRIAASMIAINFFGKKDHHVSFVDRLPTPKRGLYEQLFDSGAAMILHNNVLVGWFMKRFLIGRKPLEAMIRIIERAFYAHLKTVS